MNNMKYEYYLIFLINSGIKQKNCFLTNSDIFSKIHELVKLNSKKKNNEF